MRLTPRPETWAAVFLAANLTGCCQYWCNPAPYNPCAPTVSTTPGTVVRYGEICQVPSTNANGTAVAAQPYNRRSEILNAPPPRVVVSSPGRSSGLGGWRKADPESLATTRVEGGISSDSVQR